jgi:hypothetical protein
MRSCGVKSRKTSNPPRVLRAPAPPRERITNHSQTPIQTFL